MRVADSRHRLTGFEYRGRTAVGCVRQAVAVEVLVLHVADCPNVAVARARILAAAEAVGREVSVVERLMGSEGEAVDLGFVGSPTIWVRGHDPFADDGTSPSLACRLYLGPDGYEGAPTVEALIEVLRRG